MSYFVFLSVFQQFILRLTSNHISSFLTNYYLFNKYRYHFSFHRSMMKEFMIISTSGLCFILFTDVWWKIHDFQFQAVHIQRYFSNISRHWIHDSFSEQSVKLFLSFFLFHFNRVTTKLRGKSSNVACTLGRMQSPLLIIIFLCLKLTF